MKAFWAKITAFFMAIIAFFAGLFAGGNQPPVDQPTEPTTVIEQPTEPATEPDSGGVTCSPRIVSTLAVFGPGYPAEDGIERMARLGFEGLDLPFAYWVGEDSPFMGNDYLNWAASLKARAASKGVFFAQAHAPLDEAHTYVERTIRAAGALGAKYLVVHPTYRLNETIITDQETFIQINTEEIRRWLPTAQECGVVLLSENVLWGASSDPRILAQLAAAVDSPWFGWCFDTGHAHAKGYRPEILTQCVVAPLSVHIQDSNGGDDHLIPGDGEIDWDAFVQTLKTVGYAGDCVLEAHHQSLAVADSERDAILARLLESAKSLRDKMKQAQ